MRQNPERGTVHQISRSQWDKGKEKQQAFGRQVSGHEHPKSGAHQKCREPGYASVSPIVNLVIGHVGGNWQHETMNWASNDRAQWFF